MNKPTPEITRSKADAARSRSGLFRFSMAQFLIALILLVVAYPFVVEMENGDSIENLLMTILLGSAALAIGSRSRVLTILLLVPALTAPWIDHSGPDSYLFGSSPACTRLLWVSWSSNWFASSGGRPR